jgi:hypothetical protein
MEGPSSSWDSLGCESKQTNLLHQTRAFHQAVANCWHLDAGCWVLDVGSWSVSLTSEFVRLSAIEAFPPREQSDSIPMVLRCFLGLVSSPFDLVVKLSIIKFICECWGYLMLPKRGMRLLGGLMVIPSLYVGLGPWRK